MAFVKLSSMPDPLTTRVSSIQNLSGGLNLHDIAWQVGSTQSPAMRNMWWEDGALRSRPGQTAYNEGLVWDPSQGELYADFPGTVHPILYHGWHVYTIGNMMCAVPQGPQWDLRDIVHMKDEGEDSQCLPGLERGSFFLYDGVLYYKAPGIYYKITVSDFELYEGSGIYRLQAEDVVPYTPTTYINAVPNSAGEFGGGDAYQPDNRLSPWRCITYNFVESEGDLVFIPEIVDGQNITVEYLTKDGAWTEIKPASISQTIRQTALSFGTALTEALTEADNIATSNNVRVTYKALASDANGLTTLYDSIMGCGIAEVYGGGNGLCVVMAGYDGQPNAYFWSGNTSVAMDPTYFPVEHYNLAGDASDPITAFGKQQNLLVIFQERTIGRCSMDTTEIDGRTFITMDYATINPGIGCDMPGSIQLIQNNLVFANRKFGVMLIKDSSSAYENNVVPISRNVERPADQGGILYDIAVTPRNEVVSRDDGQRYWLCVNDHSWLWDYSLGGSVSSPANLVWFYFDGIERPAFWVDGDDKVISYVGRDGYLRRFVTTAEDTYYEDGQWKRKGEDFVRTVTLPIQDFGTYEVLKNVLKVIFVVQGSGNATIDIEYETDYEVRKDRTPIMTQGWSLVPRNLSTRNFKVFPFAVTAVRKPGCRHVRHFQCRLYIDGRGEDMAFVSAQIYFNYQGADR